MPAAAAKPNAAPSARNRAHILKQVNRRGINASSVFLMKIQRIVWRQACGNIGHVVVLKVFGNGSSVGNAAFGLFLEGRFA